MIKLLIVIFFSIVNIGCATTWVAVNAENDTHDERIYFSDVKKVSVNEESVVLDLWRQGFPITTHKKVVGEYKICFDRDMEFGNEPGFYLDKNAETEHLCKKGQQLDQLVMVEPIDSLSDSFFIPELNIAISGITSGAGISPTRSMCHCENLKNINSAVKSAVYFDRHRFYLILENGKRLRFSIVPTDSAEENKNIVFNYYEVTEATEEQFLNEKFKPKPAQIILLDPGGYLLVQLTEYNDYVFYSPNEHFFSQTDRMSRLVFSKHRETIIDQEGNKLYYALLPFAAIIDIVTIPIQIGYFVYMMTQVN